jgi:hypothetical protein
VTLLETYTHPLTVSDYMDYQNRLAVIQATKLAWHLVCLQDCEESKVTLRPPGLSGQVATRIVVTG